MRSAAHVAMHYLQIFSQGQFVLYNEKLLLAILHHTEIVLTLRKILLKLCPKEWTLQQHVTVYLQMSWTDLGGMRLLYFEQNNMGFTKGHMHF